MAQIFDSKRGIIIYESVNEFYAERGGAYSPESQHGVWNKDDMLLFSSGPHQVSPTEVLGGMAVSFSAASANRVRVSVVQETGDVYAAEQPGPRVALLGNVGIAEPDWQEHPVAQRSAVFERADEILNGYATDEDGTLGRPLSWYVEMLAGSL